MKINYKYLPIKTHYFLFLGCMAPVFPFLIVIAKQLGIPVIVQGTISALVFVFTVLVKPIIAAAADAFPKQRKCIFLLVLGIMICSTFGIIFLPSMNGRTENIITGEVVLINNSEVLYLESNFTYDVERENPFYLLTQHSQGEDREYGNHRAWGTVGWGLMGPISGFLVDWYSGGNFGKNYLPAFMILFILGSMDLILSVLKLKVPKIEKTEDLWKSVGVIMKKPTFILFLLFVIMAGAFDGVVASVYFLKIWQKTIYMKYMKFVQGLTIGVQCFLEAPFMWACGWFLKRISSSNLLSLVFLLYAFRLLCLGFIGSYGPVWLTLFVEFLNGPCYGLGYTVTVVHAGLLTPPGTSATVQSITNICYESLGYAFASLIGGIIYTYSGAPGVYYVFGLTAAVTFVLHFVTIRFWESKPPDVREESPKTVPLKPTNEIVPSVEEQEQLMPAI